MTNELTFDFSSPRFAADRYGYVENCVGRASMLAPSEALFSLISEMQCTFCAALITASTSLKSILRQAAGLALGHPHQRRRHHSV